MRNINGTIKIPCTYSNFGEKNSKVIGIEIRIVEYRVRRNKNVTQVKGRDQNSIISGIAVNP